MCVTLSDNAAAFMKRLLRMGATSADSGVRLTVSGGGCGGLASQFSVEDAAAPGEQVFEMSGVRLFMPEATCQMVRGMRVDFLDSATSGGFVFAKPEGPAGACACGAGAKVGSSSCRSAAVQAVAFPGLAPRGH